MIIVVLLIINNNQVFIMQKENSQVDLKKLKNIIIELDKIGYTYIDGFKSNKKDKIRTIHRACGNERYTKFILYSQKECRFCKRKSQSNKFNKSIDENTKKELLQLHSEGKTNAEISEIIEFTNTSIRNFLTKNQLKPNKRRSSMETSTCKVCSKKFTPKYHNRNTVCSNGCLKKLRSIQHIKYTQKDIDNVINYKERLFTNNEIEAITGVGLNKIKQIVKDNNLELTKAQANANVYRKKLEKNPNCIQDMREKNMTYTTDKFESILLQIKSDIENGMGTVGGLCLKYGLLGPSVTNAFYTRGWGDLINISASTPELEILEWVRSLGFEAYSTRKIIPPKEIDIYIPALKLGIEFCGLYWHCELQKPDKNYHYNKMKECEDKGIRLITIFEDEWKQRQKQVKNYLKSVLGIAEKRIFARKCELYNCHKNEAERFLEDNHIQGKANFKINYGLKYEGELVAIITANRHHRQGHSNELVLNRLVFSDNTQIIGGASKLLKALVRYAKHNKYDMLVSWSDNRWSQGNVYDKIGFSCTDNLSPDYSYWVGGELRESKQSNKKNLLLKKGANGDISMTENDLAKSLGYYRIWDCGKRRWKIDLNCGIIKYE